MKWKYLVVMFLCFILGGYLILSFLSQFYTSMSRDSIIDNLNASERFNDFFELNDTPFFRRVPVDRPFSPQIYLDLVSGIMFIVAGLTIWYLIREEEISLLKDQMADIFLLPEEKSILGELKKSKGEMTQKDLVNKTGLSKVKIHRTLNKLEKKGVIKRAPYGMTKKIVMAK
ncbi:MAG: winged helix-turn-helix transcriptional regulator [Candidatus Aenigmarchaeota archaeon]|nr:winged helix-turn-helix transcriptional regulator [Candidatus Aenigmarchaeota archaeon]